MVRILHTIYRNVLGVFPGLLIFTAVSCAQQPAGFKSINAGEFKEIFLKDSGVVLDVRTPGEFRSGHVAQAVMMDITQADFEEKIKALDKEKTYYVYCRSGNRSTKASALMTGLGFTKVYNIRDGIDNILKSGVPESKE